MNILLVDDSDEKSELIASAINKFTEPLPQHRVTRVENLADAIRVLSVIAFDLIILDLMIPYLQGGDAESRAGVELARLLRSQGGPNKTTAVIAISAFPHEVVAFRNDFDRYGVLITQFDDENAWIQSLHHAMAGVNARSSYVADLDFLIICALEEERSGFAHTGFEKISEAVVSGLNVHYVRSPQNSGFFGAIVRLSQMGLVAATFETTSALNIFRTRILCMSGVCAGFANEAALGQLVVASPAWEYQAGKWSTNRFEIAPVQIALPPATRAIIDLTIGSADFVAALERDLEQDEARPTHRSRAILAPFASGSAVIADSKRLEAIALQHRKVTALDMEAFGMYYSAHEFGPALRHYFAVKCVVDLADADKGDDLHPYGCVISARAAEQLIGALLRAEAKG